jgi:hypothetical protein
MVGANLANLLLLAEAARRVPEPTRSIALMALVGILLVGVFLIAVTMLGGSWVRKLGHVRRGPVVPPDLMIQRRNQPPTSDSQDTTTQLPNTGDTQPTDETQVS